MAYVTVIDDDGEPKALPAEEAWQQSAIFLAWWEPVGGQVRMSGTLEAGGLEQITQTIDTTTGVLNMLASGNRQETPVPFTVVGTAESLTFHVIWNTPDLPGGMAGHEQAKRTFTRENVPVKLVGVYSNVGAGLYTHYGDPLHVHVMLSENGQIITGHVDAIELTGGATVQIGGDSKEMFRPE